MPGDRAGRSPNRFGAQSKSSVCPRARHVALLVFALTVTNWTYATPLKGSPLAVGMEAQVW
jgi:hypothetical protein